MKIFVTGVCGQLGYDVVKECLKRNIEVVGSDIADSPEQFDFVKLDITNENLVLETIAKAKPDVVIHCAAWTAVDAAEDNVDKVFAINEKGTEYIAKACKTIDCKMLYISTDYVFNGQGNTPWEPDCKEYEPLNVYGKSKLAGELAVQKILNKSFIVRIAWVFGKNGNNFIKTMLKIGKEHDELRVVADQIGTPTYTVDLARLLIDMILTDRYGYYHATNEGGYISWYEFACEIFRQAKYNVKVIPITTKDYTLSKAKRPFNSRLDKSKLIESGFTPLPDWHDALQRYLAVSALTKDI